MCAEAGEDLEAVPRAPSVTAAALIRNQEPEGTAQHYAAMLDSAGAEKLVLVVQ
jgi:hypothetical protein